MTRKQWKITTVLHHGALACDSRLEGFGNRDSFGYFSSKEK
jgi:hypothetical protein